MIECNLILAVSAVRNDVLLAASIVASWTPINTNLHLLFVLISLRHVKKRVAAFVIAYLLLLYLTMRCVRPSDNIYFISIYKHN